jgi:hypothetical protein
VVFKTIIAQYNSEETQPTSVLSGTIKGLFTPTNNYFYQFYPFIDVTPTVQIFQTRILKKKRDPVM